MILQLRNDVLQFNYYYCFMLLGKDRGMYVLQQPEKGQPNGFLHIDKVGI